jgi:hypothetical protein
MEKPLELLVLCGLFVFSGTLGLLDILYLARPGMDAFIILLVLCYVFIQPLIAYALWSVWPYALKAGRTLAFIMLLFSFFLYSALTPFVLVANTLMYLYSILCLYRQDIKTIYGED